MKYLVTLVLLVSASFFLSAQPVIKFTNLEHDYGDISEDDGPAETIFEFVNEGNEPLILNNVKATCGCTTPEWTRTPIGPKEKGNIKVIYNPKNRPGAFTKTVNVYSNTQPSISVLTIKGKVLPHEKTVEEIYPREMGPVRLKNNYLSLGSMKNVEQKKDVLEYINTSDKPVKLGVHRAPDHIKVSFDPAVIQPGKEGKIIVDYDASKKNAFGYISDRIYLSVDDEKNNSYSIGTSVTIEEDFTQLTADELAKAPVAVFAEKTYDFGNIKEGDKVNYAFKLANRGKSDLLIRNVKTSCGCTAVKHANVVKPGETINLEIEFNSRGKRSRQNKSITVITNDPKNATTVLRIMGNVEAAE